MKYYYIIALWAISNLFVACEKEEPPFYDTGSNGVYFDYSSTDDLSSNINFADYALENPEELSVNIKLKVLGYLLEEDRKVVLKTKVVEGYPEAEIELPEVIFHAKESAQTIEVKVKHPAELGTRYATCIYFDTEDPESQLGEGIEGFNEFTIYATEEYQEPVFWPGYGSMYLGEWSPEKHVFLIHVTQNNNYMDTPYLCVQYNVAAVDSLWKFREENPGQPVTISIPIGSDPNLRYNKPAYWTSIYDQYLGNYNPSTFGAVCRGANITTLNDYEYFANDEAKAKEINISAVSSMMNQYDTYFMQQMPGMYYRNYYWIPMFKDIDYEVHQPACWADPDGGALLSKYYGEYSDAKYKFMIRTWLERQGNNFVLVQIFPVMVEWDYSLQIPVVLWDESLDPNFESGENVIKECYKAFKEEYDKNPSAYDFEFPEVSLE